MRDALRQAEWAVYVLLSERLGRTYVGCSSDVPLRLSQHNAGAVRATRNGTPWRLALTEPAGTYEQALHRERYYKSGAGRRRLKVLLTPRSPSSPDAALPAPACGGEASPGPGRAGKCCVL